MNFVKRILVWLDDRSGFSDVVLPMLRHVVPDDARWWYVFGSATLCAFAVQLISGIALATTYVPGGDAAYESLLYITNEAPLGNLLRGMHYYGATAMVVLAIIHMTQVFLHAAYKYPRELNWMSGVVLLFVVLGMSFTGQLLRWDANGVWSVTVAAEMAGRAPLVGPAIAHGILGGETVGGSTLTRFFAIHVFVLPGLILAGVGLHLWLVLRHGISEMPKVDEPVDPQTYKEEYEARLAKTGVPFWPIAAWRDAVFSVAVMALIVGCAIIFGPPAVIIDGVTRFLFTLPITFHDLRALHTQLPWLSKRHILAIAIHHFHRRTRDRFANGAQLNGIVGVEADDRRRLGKAVAFGDRATGGLLPTLSSRLGQRHAAGNGQFQFGEVELFEVITIT